MQLLVGIRRTSRSQKVKQYPEAKGLNVFWSFASCCSNSFQQSLSLVASKRAMALRFAGFALTVSLAGAQLLPEQPVDFDELQRLMEKEGLSEGQDLAVPTNLSSPTICDSSVKQHSGRDHHWHPGKIGSCGLNMSR